MKKITLAFALILSMTSFAQAYSNNKDILINSTQIDDYFIN